MRLNNSRRRSISDKFDGSDAFIISTALSNICAPMMKRSSPDRVIILSRTIRSFSGDVSVIFRLSTINHLLSTILESFLGRAFAQKLGDIEVDEIGVMENDRLD